jgi:copper chaperone
MFTFEVKDMSCGHCVGTITKAVAAADSGAKVHVDLATHRVHIESSRLSEAALKGVIEAAGYTPVALSGPAVPAVKAAPRQGCCCG